MKRTFEFNDDKSSKFWSIETNGSEFTVTYGKVGTTGQSQTKTFADEAACTKEANKLIAEKTKKGYVEQGGSPVVAPTTQTAEAGTSAKASKPAANAAPATKKPSPASKQPEITTYDSWDETQTRAFLRAIRSGKLDLVRQYIAAGANPAKKIKAAKHNKVAPVMEALINNRPEVMSELIAHADSYPTNIGSDDRVMSVMAYIAVMDSELYKITDRAQLVQTLLENGYDVKKDSKSILNYYSRMELPEDMLKILRDSVSLEGDKGDYLFRAMEESKYEKDKKVPGRVMELIDLGVKINPTGETDKYLIKDYGSALHLALTLFGTHYDLIKKFVDKGADLTIRNTKQIILSGNALAHIPQNYTPLQLAQSDTIEVSPEVLTLLKERSPKDENEEILANGSSEKKLIVLSMTSPQQRNTEADIRTLIKQGVDVNATDHDGKTALHHLAVHENYVTALNLLPDFIKAGANVSARDNEGRTPLFYIHTAMRGISSLYKAFIGAGADINARDNKGNTPAIYATLSPQDSELMGDILRIHLACGADPYITTDDGNTLLHFAVKSKSGFEFEELLDSLLKSGADINAKNVCGRTPLHVVVASEGSNSDDEDIVEGLLSGGADINARDNEGNTALHLATDEDIVEKILAGLPDIAIKNNDGVTAADSVRSRKFDNEDIDSALEALSKAPVAERKAPELKWTPHTINLSDTAPQKLEIVSGMLVPNNDGEMFIYSPDDNLIAVCGRNKIGLQNFTMIDTITGRVLWEKRGYDDYCSQLPPICDNGILYMPQRVSGNSSLYACNSRTGEEIWTCKTGNSYGQYTKGIKQNEKYVFNVNADTKKLYIIDKATGKMKMAKLAHPPFEDNKSDVMPWKDQILVVGLDKKKDRFLIDQYDPEKAEFVQTILELGDYNTLKKQDHPLSLKNH